MTWLRAKLPASFFKSKIFPDPQYELKVVCDDITTIFVDGEQKNVPGTGAWNQLATLQIPASTGAIGIQCRNTGGPYGIMAQVADSQGNILVVSDHTWKCSNTPQAGWSTSGFSEDDSWKRPFLYLGQKAYNSDTGAWKGMSPNKKVIWSSPRDATAYCRKELSKSSGNHQDQVILIYTLASLI